MKTISSIAGLAAVLCLALPANAQPKTYDLSFEAKPKKGITFQDVISDKLKMRMKLIKDGKVMLNTSEIEASRFEMTRTILEVEGDEITKESIVFQKAVHEAEGVESAYGFQGKTVIATTSAGGTTYAYEDGTALTEADVEGIQEAKLGKDQEDEGGQKLLAPGKPVKAGESWKPDVLVLATDMLDLSGPEAINLKKSSAKVTLLKVKQKGGVTFGTVKGMFKFWISEFGELKLQKPVLAKITFAYEMALDGSVPDGKMEMSMQIKGTSPSEIGPNEVVGVSLDITGELKRTAKTLP